MFAIPANGGLHPAHHNSGISTEPIAETIKPLPKGGHQVACGAIYYSQQLYLFALFLETGRDFICHMPTLAITGDVIRPMRLFGPNELHTMFCQISDFGDLRRRIKTDEIVMALQKPGQIVTFNKSL